MITVLSTYRAKPIRVLTEAGVASKTALLKTVCKLNLVDLIIAFFAIKIIMQKVEHASPAQVFIQRHLVAFDAAVMVARNAIPAIF